MPDITEIQKTVYQVGDREFISRDEALHHYATEQLRELMDKTSLGRGGEWDQKMIFDWMLEHAKQLGPLFIRISMWKDRK